jgi:hypothetical protein
LCLFIYFWEGEGSGAFYFPSILTLDTGDIKLFSLDIHVLDKNLPKSFIGRRKN